VFDSDDLQIEWSLYTESCKKLGHQPLLIKKVTDISQGSIATCLGCGGLINDDFLCTCCWLWWWKNFENLSACNRLV